MENKAQSHHSEKPPAVNPTRNIGDELKDEGRRLIEDAKASAFQLASDRRDAATAYVGALAGAARSGADELDQSGYSRSAATIERASKDVASFAERLSKRSPANLVADLEDFARERPVLMFSLAFAAAFGATRFLRTSGNETTSGTADETAPPAVDVTDKTERQTLERAGL